MTSSARPLKASLHIQSHLIEVSAIGVSCDAELADLEKREAEGEVNIVIRDTRNDIVVSMSLDQRDAITLSDLLKIAGNLP